MRENLQSISDLPEDILVEILSRLPAKWVGRCRRVSKRWRALLSQPKFIRTHLDYSTKHGVDSLFLLKRKGKSSSYASLSSAHHLFDKMSLHEKRLSFAHHPDSSSWTRVDACCDGWILVRDKKLNAFLLNPITREIKELPPMHYPDTTWGAFNGFGYDPASDDYKVVTFFMNCDFIDGVLFRDLFVYVCSLKAGAWRRVESGPYDHGYSQVHSHTAVFVHVRLHFPAIRTTDCRSVIVAFDLAKETFSELPPPNSIDGHLFVVNYILTVIRGCLWLYTRTDEELWLMKEYGVQESWTKLTIHDPERLCYQPLGLMGEEQLETLKFEYKYGTRCDEKVILYNLKRGTLKDVVINGRRSNGLQVIASFVESLVSPRGTWQ